MYFQMDFSLYCQYAGETILGDLYRVMASDPFTDWVSTGRICIRDNLLDLAIF